MKNQHGKINKIKQLLGDNIETIIKPRLKEIKNEKHELQLEIPEVQLNSKVLKDIIYNEAINCARAQGRLLTPELVNDINKEVIKRVNLELESSLQEINKEMKYLTIEENALNKLNDDLNLSLSIIESLGDNSQNQQQLVHPRRRNKVDLTKKPIPTNQIKQQHVDFNEDNFLNPIEIWNRYLPQIEEIVHKYDGELINTGFGVKIEIPDEYRNDFEREASLTLPEVLTRFIIDTKSNEGKTLLDSKTKYENEDNNNPHNSEECPFCKEEFRKEYEIAAEKKYGKSDINNIINSNAQEIELIKEILKEILLTNKQYKRSN